MISAPTEQEEETFDMKNDVFSVGHEEDYGKGETRKVKVSKRSRTEKELDQSRYDVLNGLLHEETFEPISYTDILGMPRIFLINIRGRAKAYRCRFKEEMPSGSPKVWR